MLRFYKKNIKKILKDIISKNIKLEQKIIYILSNYTNYFYIGSLIIYYNLQYIITNILEPLYLSFLVNRIYLILHFILINVTLNKISNFIKNVIDNISKSIFNKYVFCLLIECQIIILKFLFIMIAYNFYIISYNYNFVINYGLLIILSIIKFKIYIYKKILFLQILELISYNLFKKNNKVYYDNNNICAICYCEYNKAKILYCKHVFCYNCITKWLEIKNKCPICLRYIPNKLNYYTNDWIF